jgi:hypothetical protein
MFNPSVRPKDGSTSSERENDCIALHLVSLFASQLAVLFFHINSAPAISYLPVSSIFLSQQISTNHQPPEPGD